MLLYSSAASRSARRADRDLGGDGSIAVIMGTYQPNVQCGAPFAGSMSCSDIIAGMPAISTMGLFGPDSIPAVTEALPVLIRSSKLSVTSDFRAQIR